MHFDCISYCTGTVLAFFDAGFILDKSRVRLKENS